LRWGLENFLFRAVKENMAGVLSVFTAKLFMAQDRVKGMGAAKGNKGR